MTDATICYICYEIASDAQPFLNNSVCACKGSLTLHRTCYEQTRLLAPDATTCSVCKQPFNDPEMFVAFDETNMDGYRYVGRRHKLARQLDGPYMIYHSNGALWIQTNYTNGKRNGEHREYYEDGQLERECIYKDDEIHGLYMQYYEDGGLCLKTTYVNGEYHGTYKEFYRGGKLAYLYTYKYGTKYGDAMSYYDTGVTRRVVSFSLTGGQMLQDIYYNTSGSLESIHYYTDDELACIVEYYDNGEKASEKKYKEGKCIYSARWTSTGELI